MALSFDLGSALLLLLPSSRKRAISSSSTAATAAAPPKRARRRETTSVRTPPPPPTSSSSPCDDGVAILPVSSSSPPSLEPSTTFESSSIVNDVDDDHATNEGRRRRRSAGDRGGVDAMSAARARLRSARTCASHSLESLRRARSEYCRTAEEARRAEECLRSMERKWEVVYVDADVGEEDKDLSACSSRSSSPSRVSGFEDEGGMPRLVRVGRAGDAIVNGTYRALLPHSAIATTLDRRRARSMPTGPIYVHADGPFEVQGDLHDVCIFLREGYGDKVRWCIGLVPRRRCCHPLDGADRASRPNNDDVNYLRDDVEWRQRQRDRGGHGGRDFALAYIYYWMEVDANEIDVASLLSNRDGKGASSSWGVCHGARPLPTLEDISDGGMAARWWQFWKQG